jgi:hypothetical protein
MISATPRLPALGGLILFALALGGAPAAAGEFAVEGQVGYLGLTASDSAQAVLGSTGGLTWGAAGRYTFYKSLYANVGFRTFSASGERVFVAGATDPVSKLGFPLSVRLTPVTFIVGYRFRDGELIVPYGGVGGSINLYSEESSVAGISYDESFSKAGFNLVGGVEIGRGRFRFAAEAGWSTVPNAIGLGGVSEVYGEDDLGGWSVVGKVVVAFGGKTAPEADGPDESEEPADDQGPPEPETP